MSETIQIKKSFSRPKKREHLLDVASGYQRTEAGAIPGDWDVLELDSVIGVIDGDRGRHYPAAADFSESGYCLFLNAGNVTNDGFNFEDCAFITRAKDQQLRKGKLQRQDIVLTTRGTVGNFAFYDETVSFDHLRINSGMVILRNENPEIDTEFLYSQLRSYSVEKQIERLAFGSAQPQLTVKGISKLLLAIPPRQLEQRAIAEALSDMDELLGRLDAVITKKRAIRQGARQQLLNGTTRLPGFVGEWKAAFIVELERRNLVRLSRGKVISKQDIKATPGEFPIYSSSIQSLGLFGRYGEYMFDEELITWSVDGGGDFFYRPKHKFSVTNVCGFMRVETSQIDYRFLAAQLQLLHGLKSFDYQSKAHPSVIRKEYEVWLPPLGEQTAIADVLTAIDAEIAALEARRDKTLAIKQGMMQQLLTGRIRLVKPQPAEVEA